MTVLPSVEGMHAACKVDAGVIECVCEAATCTYNTHTQHTHTHTHTHDMIRVHRCVRYDDNGDY